MELRAGYKRTAGGLIPETWDTVALGDLFTFKNGLNKAKSYFGHGTPIVNYMDIYRHSGLHTEDIRGRVSLEKQEIKNFEVKKGDVFFTRTSETVEDIGVAAVMLNDPTDTVFSGFVLRARPNDDSLCDEFKKYCFASQEVRRQIVSKSTYTTRALTNGRSLSAVFINRPPKPEQEAIARALSDVDDLIVSIDQLITKKRNIKCAAMQELLTGRIRLPGFGNEWAVKRIADIASPKSEKNVVGDSLPVLTCSKHLGFVDSLEFFKNQVFSKDLSAYKVIRRGEIGYPANHVEEGSIGLQDRYDMALVSPIYVVFAVSEETDSFFVHRLLKLDSYRQKFRTATTSSVDRRGSLRWPDFSEITIRIPSLPEQTAIAAVLKDIEAELELLEQRLAKARALKQCALQQLLAGRIRLV